MTAAEIGEIYVKRSKEMRFTVQNGGRYLVPLMPSPAALMTHLSPDDLPSPEVLDFVFMCAPAPYGKGTLWRIVCRNVIVDRGFWPRNDSGPVGMNDRNFRADLRQAP